MTFDDGCIKPRISAVIHEINLDAINAVCLDLRRACTWIYNPHSGQRTCNTVCIRLQNTKHVKINGASMAILQGQGRSTYQSQGIKRCDGHQPPQEFQGVGQYCLK